MTLSLDRTLDGLQRAAQRTERAQDARPRRTPLQRAMGSMAATLSRRAIAEREASVCNAALHRLVDLVYERVDGALCNIDPDTGRVLIPMPTGRKRYSAYGLTSTQQRALRAAMLLWAKEDAPPPLFSYDELTRSWYVCLWNYADLRTALRWLDVRKITAGMWLGVKT